MLVLDPTIGSPGDELLAHNQFKSARHAYREAIKEHPEQVAFRLGLTRTLLRLDAWPAAVIQAGETVKKFPENADAYGLYAIALIRSGDWDKAAKEANLSLQKDPNSYWGLVASGRVADWNEQRKTASHDFRKATKLHPEWPDAWQAWLEFLAEGVDGTQQDAIVAHSYVNTDPHGYPHDDMALGLKMQFKTLKIQQVKEPYSPFTVTAGRNHAVDQPYHTSIPMEVGNNHVVWSVNLQGHGLKLLFDTGVGGNLLLGHKASRHLPLPILAKTRIDGMSGYEFSKIMKAKTLLIGGITYHNIPIETVHDMGKDYDGLLPGSAVDDAVVTLDYHDRMASIDRGKDAGAPHPLAGDKIIHVPFHFYRDHIFLHVFVNGVRMWGMIDTGCPRDLLSLRAAQSGVGGRQKLQHDSSSSYQIKGIGDTDSPFESFRPLKNVSLSLNQNSPITILISSLLATSAIDKQFCTNMEFEIGIIIGMSDLSAFQRMTFDYPHRMLTLEYVDPDAHTPHGN